MRDWITGVGVENIGKKLVNSREGKVEFEKPSVSAGGHGAVACRSCRSKLHGK